MSSTATVLFHAEVAEHAGLGSSDHKTLDILLREGPLTASEIARRTGLAAASVTSLIDRLESRGFVRRTRDASDRRLVVVEAVPEGVGQIAELFAPLARSMSALLDSFSTKQLETIRDYLTRSAVVLNKEAKRLRERE